MHDLLLHGGGVHCTAAPLLLFAHHNLVHDLHGRARRAAAPQHHRHVDFLLKLVKLNQFNAVLHRGEAWADKAAHAGIAVGADTTQLHRVSVAAAWCAGDVEAAHLWRSETRLGSNAWVHVGIESGESG